MNVKISPPIYFYICLIFSIGLLLHPVFQYIRYPYTLIGIPCIVYGIGINLWADYLFKKEKTTIKPGEKPTALIEYGPFRFSRNPIYLGMAVILFGFAILSGSLLSFIFPIAFTVFMQVIFIPGEERNMEAVFGKRYVRYKYTVKRWV